MILAAIFIFYIFMLANAAFVVLTSGHCYVTPVPVEVLPETA